MARFLDLPNKPMTTVTKSLNEFLESLRVKWKEIPTSTQQRALSTDILELNDEDFLQTWNEWYTNNCAGESGYSTRGWYHDLYRPLANEGGAWLEVGSGMGYDGTYFASQGAHVTFVDIVESNLNIVERICKLRNLSNVEFVHMRELSDLNSLKIFDCVLVVGSLINAPYEFMCEERRLLADHLRTGGRWLELGYPQERWKNEGSLPFTEWGDRTDGGAPWIEWYDLEKLTRSLEPHQFDMILAHNYHDDEFNWFDLLKKS